MGHTKGEEEVQIKTKSRLANVLSFGAYRKSTQVEASKDLDTYAAPFSQTQAQVKKEVRPSADQAVDARPVLSSTARTSAPLNQPTSPQTPSVLERSLSDAPQKTRTNAKEQEGLSEKDLDIQIRRRTIELRELTPHPSIEGAFRNPRTGGGAPEKSHIESLLEKIRNIDVNDVATRFDRPNTVRSMVSPTEPSVQKALRHLDKEIHATQVQAAKNFISSPVRQVEEETAILLKSFVSAEGMAEFAKHLTHERISTKRQQKPASPEMLLAFSNEIREVMSFPERAIQGDLFIEDSLGIMDESNISSDSYIEKREQYQDRIFSSKQINTVTMMASWVNTMNAQRKGALLIQPDFIRIDKKMPIAHEAFIGGVLADKARTSCLLKGRAESDMGNTDLNVLSVHLFRPKVMLDSEQTHDKPHPLQARDFRSSTFAKWLEPSVGLDDGGMGQIPLIEHFLHDEIESFGAQMKPVLLESFKMAKMFQAEGISMDEKSLTTLDFSVDKRIRLCQDHGIIVTPSKIRFLAQIYMDESGNRMTLGEAFARCARYRDLDPSKIEMTDMPISLILAHLLAVIAQRGEISDKAWAFLCLADQLVRRGSAVSRYEQNGQTKGKNKQLTDLRLWLIAEQQSAALACQQGSNHFLSPSIEFVDASAMDTRAEFEHYTRPTASLEREDIVQMLDGFGSLTADLRRNGVFCEKVYRFLDSMTT